MKTHQSWDEMGITQDMLFKSDVSMPYWLQYKTKDFLQSMSHELKTLGAAINAYLKFIYDDPNIANLPVSATSNTMTVKDICEVIFRSISKARDITDIMWEYSKTLDAEDAPKE